MPSPSLLTANRPERGVVLVTRLYIYRRRRSRASPVLTAISLVNGKPWETVNFDSPQNRHTLSDR